MITQEQKIEVARLVLLAQDYMKKEDYVGCITALYFQTARLHLAIRAKATSRPPVKEPPKEELPAAEPPAPVAEKGEG